VSEPKPLAGVRILDLTRLLPGGYCTMLLADMGADVLKVEEPGKGDYIRWMGPFRGDVSAGHLALNRGKRSMTLNLKHPRGAEVLRSLASSYDVLVESFRPGVMDRLGVGYDTLAGINPRLVYCAITGYGQDGPYMNKAGHDANYLGYAGVTDLNGARNGPPIMVGVQIADIGGGGLMGAVGILGALQGRHATGKGRFVDISMTDGALSWIGFHLQPHFFTGEPVKRGRGRINGRLACYQLYECGDGRWISVGALEPQFWDTFCRAIGLPEFIPRHLEESEEGQDGMADRISEILKTKPRSEWLALLEDLEACVGPINSIEEALSDPHIQARGMIAAVPTGEGPVQTIASPIRDRGEKPGAYPPAPGFGEHTDAVLHAEGFTDAEVASLRAAGAI
jgi:alpha-methylacyl-CoA racemase